MERRLCFAPTSALLVWGQAHWKVRLWDLEKDRAVAQPTGMVVDHGTAFAFLPGTPRLAILNRMRELEVWDLVKDCRLFSFTTGGWEGDRPNWYLGHRLVVNHRGTLAATDYWEVPVLGLRHQRPLFLLPKQQGFPRCLEWAPVADVLAIGCGDGSVVLWKLPLIQEELRRIGLGWQE